MEWKSKSLIIALNVLEYVEEKTTEIYAHLALETFHDVVGLLRFGSEKKNMLKVGVFNNTWFTADFNGLILCRLVHY